MEFKYLTADQAFHGLVGAIYTDPGRAVPRLRRSPSRNGDVLRFTEPVMVTYLSPTYRVLFNQARDCNPFFHVYESLWMLAGRDDVEPVAYYNSGMRNYSDDGVTFNAAYGYRWRHAWGLVDPTYDDSFGWCVDQLKLIIEELREDPSSRRVVLQMWDTNDLGVYAKTLDKACNTQAYFDIVEGKLNMTVCNRSNDLVWGCLGANICHFSYLQEYLAAHIGVGVGLYHQFTNNLHVYTERFTPELWLNDKTKGYYQFGNNWRPFKLVEDPNRFDGELQEFVERHSQDSLANVYKEPFFRYVAQPMCIAFHLHKHRRYEDAYQEIKRIRADDWRVVCQNWISKREDMWRNKKAREK